MTREEELQVLGLKLLEQAEAAKQLATNAAFRADCAEQRADRAEALLRRCQNEILIAQATCGRPQLYRRLADLLAELEKVVGDG